MTIYFQQHLMTLIGLVVATPIFACGKPILTLPTQQEIPEISPQIEWLPVDNITHYQVSLESRVPEGRVLLNEEFRTTETQLIPPKPLATDKATVTIKIVAVCKDHSQAETVTRVRINPTLTCNIGTKPTFEHKDGHSQLGWTALPNAHTYEIRAHSATSGKPGVIFEAKQPPVSLSHIPSGIWVLAVQAKCGIANGASQYLSVLLP